MNKTLVESGLAIIDRPGAKVDFGGERAVGFPLEKKLISKALSKQDVSGFAEASNIIKVALDEIDALTKKENQANRINQAE